MNGWVDCMILHGFNVWDEGMMSVTSPPRTTSNKTCCKHSSWILQAGALEKCTPTIRFRSDFC